MRKYAFGLLFTLGGFEMLFGLLCAARAYSFEPVFRRTFGVSTFTPDQKQAYDRFISGNQNQWSIVAFFGVVTVVLGIVLLLTSRRKGDA